MRNRVLNYTLRGIHSPRSFGRGSAGRIDSEYNSRDVCVPLEFIPGFVPPVSPLCRDRSSAREYDTRRRKDPPHGETEGRRLANSIASVKK